MFKTINLIYFIKKKIQKTLNHQNDGANEIFMVTQTSNNISIRLYARTSILTKCDNNIQILFLTINLCTNFFYSFCLCFFRMMAHSAPNPMISKLLRLNTILFLFKSFGCASSLHNFQL